MMTPGFWRGRRVLVTGHTGFKGAWLSLWLGKLGAHVTGYGLAPATHPSLFDLAGLERGMDSVIGDVRDASALQRCVAHARPEVIFHLAAQALVRTSYEVPAETYATNVMGTVNLFEAVREAPNVLAVVNVTSDKCYENRESQRGYLEDDALGGSDPYSSSKACAELVTSAYRRSFFEQGPAVATARAGNVLGGGDWARDRLVPDMIGAFLRKEPVRIRYPEAIRPWQHVLDSLHGYLQLAESLVRDGTASAEAWNFGPGDASAINVAQLATRLSDLWGGDAAWQLESVHQPPESRTLKLDASKARRDLGWQPVLPLEETLRFVVAWYRAHHAGQDMRTFTLQQIEAFEVLAASKHEQDLVHAAH